MVLQIFIKTIEKTEIGIEIATIEPMNISLNIKIIVDKEKIEANIKKTFITREDFNKPLKIMEIFKKEVEVEGESK